MIFEGSEGSISIFFRGKLIASKGLKKKSTYEFMVKEANRLIIDGMHHKVPIKEQVKLHYIHLAQSHKWNQKYKSRKDQAVVVLAMLCLLKLKFFSEEDPENGILIMPKRKEKRIVRT